MRTPWGVEQHHWNTGAKENQQLNPGLIFKYMYSWYAYANKDEVVPLGAIRTRFPQIKLLVGVSPVPWTWVHWHDRRLFNCSPFASHLETELPKKKKKKKKKTVSDLNLLFLKNKNFLGDLFVAFNVQKRKK